MQRSHISKGDKKVKPTAGVFCHNGLGDGVNCLVLSNHLHLNGFQVTTYQNTIGSMQNWFPHLPVVSYPSLEELPRILQAYDWYFVVWNDANELVRQLILEGKRRFPDRLKVIYLYPSKHIVNEPYYTDCLTEHDLSVAENMRILSMRVMHLPKTTESNGFIPPQGLQFKKYPKRLVMHPTSGKASKNWPKEKFVKLALHLKKEGFEPVFVPGAKEMPNWLDIKQQGLELADFSTLDELTRFIYESGYLVGNDSGLGHVASAIGIQTLILCRRKAVAKMWAPSFTKGQVLTPSSFIPNIRGFRLRDRCWHHFITVKMAWRAFERLVQTDSV
ncbi:MAG TPA: glycosyltransferase family 9 protein [Chlamydiales bacterium]